MTTKSVGIRELKEQAPKLVQRAEGGERVAITRHGKVVAVLAPASEVDSADASRPRLAEWQRERRHFEELAPKLQRHYRGLFVAMLDGQVIDSDADATKLFERATRAAPGRVLFIGRVAAAEPVVDMPGFTLE